MSEELTMQDLIDQGEVDEGIAQEELRDFEIDGATVSELKFIIRVAKAGGIYAGGSPSRKDELIDLVERLKRKFGP